MFDAPRRGEKDARAGAVCVCVRAPRWLHGDFRFCGKKGNFERARCAIDADLVLESNFKLFFSLREVRKKRSVYARDCRNFFFFFRDVMYY